MDRASAGRRRPGGAHAVTYKYDSLLLVSARRRGDGVSALVVRVRELGVLGVGALSFVLRDLVLVPRRDLRLEHGLRVAARSVGRVGL